MHATDHHQTKQPQRNTTHPEQPENSQTGKTNDAAEKKTAGVGRGLGEGENEDERVEFVTVVRVQDEESQGETQTPNGAWVSPAPEREKDRENNVAGEHPHNKREEREDNKHQSEQGAGLKGHHSKQHFDPRDQKCHTTKPNIYPKNPEQKCHLPIKQSLGGIITAGWRGPWAALLF